ncbi:MAG: ParB/RepB/Spo0J family partition protein [Candidatus Dormibacteria bacterium]
MAAIETRRTREAAALDRLLGQRPAAGARIFKAISVERLARVPISAIRPNPQQPRHEFDAFEIAELAQTIRLHGLQLPIVVEQPDEGVDDFVLTAGERRLRAYRVLAEEAASPQHDPSDYETIPSIIRSIRSEEPERDRLVKALVENICRVNLSVDESAAGFRRLKDMTGWSWNAVAAHMGLDAERIRRLASLDGRTEILDPLGAGSLTQPQAFAMARLPSDVAGELAAHVGGLSEGETRRAVRAARTADPAAPPAERAAAGLRAVGRALVGPRPTVVTERAPISSGGHVVGEITTDWVELSATPLWQLRRATRIERAQLGELLQATCEQLGIWPVKPGAGRKD